MNSVWSKWEHATASRSCCRVRTRPADCRYSIATFSRGVGTATKGSTLPKLLISKVSETLDPRLHQKIIQWLYEICVTGNPILMKLILSYSCTLTFSIVTDGFGHAKTARLVSLVPLSRWKTKDILLLQSNNLCCKNVWWGNYLNYS